MATPINSCTWLVLSLVLCGVAYGQLSFHNDPSQNSFSIKLPSFQQSFTRYFGNQPHGALLQQQQQPLQAQQQQQQQQLQQTAGVLNQASLYAGHPQPYHLSQQRQQQPESINRYVAQFPEQPHYTVQENYINPNIRQRIQQQRLQQQQQQQQQHHQQEQQQQQQQQQQLQPQQYYPQPSNYQGFSFGQSQSAQDANGFVAGNQQPQYEYIQQPSGPDGGNGGLNEQQQHPGAGIQYQPAGLAGQRAQAAPYAQAPANGEADAYAPNKLIGVAFSPSNEVSQVKFSSNGLKYNF